MITDKTIKELVNEEFERSILNISELDVYSVTSNIPKQGLRQVLVFNERILEWIKQIIDSDKEIATLENKVKIIKEIFNTMDKNFKESKIE